MGHQHNAHGPTPAESPTAETLQELNTTAAASLGLRQEHVHYPSWKHTDKLQVPMGARLALTSPVPCQTPTHSDNWEYVSDGLSFNQCLRQSFAAQWHYNNLQTIKASEMGY